MNYLEEYLEQCHSQPSGELLEQSDMTPEEALEIAGYLMFFSTYQEDLERNGSNGGGTAGP
ncbi:MAG: hypothetical protein ABEJ64_00390 [Candidatus Nanohaloarchaea archaeon]